MIVYILNLLDLFFTIHAVSNGGTELNPISRFMIEISPVCYGFYKIVVIGVAVWWLTTRSERLARVGLRVCTAFYAWFFLDHLFNVLNVLL